MSGTMQTGVRNFVHRFILYKYNGYSSATTDFNKIPLFTKYIEVEGGENRDEWEIPTFLYDAFDNSKLNDKSFKVIFPIYPRISNYYLQAPASVTTLNSFCSRLTGSLRKVTLKNNTYMGSPGILLDDYDNILMMSTVKYEKVTVYISVQVLENLNKTVEKAIMQKFVPKFIEWNCDIKIIKDMPFVKTVQNRVGNINFAETCYETIKESAQLYKVLCKKDCV